MLDASGPDIVVAIETWLDFTIHGSERQIDGYTISNCDRPRGKHKGVIIVVASHITASAISVKNKTPLALLWIKMHYKFQPNIMLGGVYLPHSADKTSWVHIQYAIERLKFGKVPNIEYSEEISITPVQTSWTRQPSPTANHVAQHNAFLDILTDYGQTQTCK